MAKEKKRDKRREPKKSRKKKPPPPSCACDCSQTFYAVTEALRLLDPVKIHRYAIKVSCTIVCDPSTPGQCQYNYGVSVSIWARDIDQHNQPTGDWYETDHKPAIQSFRMDDPQMKFELNEMEPREIMLRYSAYKPLAPEKANVEVTAFIQPSLASTELLIWTESVELCMPRLANPNCPEWI